MAIKQCSGAGGVTLKLPPEAGVVITKIRLQLRLRILTVLSKT